MPETESSPDEAMHFVDEAAASDAYDVLYGDPVSHAEEKMRRARSILLAIGARDPVLRPLSRSEAVSSTPPVRCPDAELQVTAGPQFIICLSPANLETLEGFTQAFAEQADMDINIDALTHLGEAPEQAWPRLARALRWLALTEDDWKAITRN